MAELVPGGIRVSPLSGIFLEVLVRHLGGLRREVMLAVFFDDGGVLVGHTFLGEGGSASVAGRYRSVIERAFQLGAHGFVLTHNHPSGDPSPSRADIAATRSLAAVARALELDFHDHVVVGGRSATSMRAARLIGREAVRSSSPRRAVK